MIRGLPGFGSRRVIAWIDVRPQIVPGDAVEPLRCEHVFGRQSLRRP